MTNEELNLLSRGRVPAEPIVTLVKRYLHECGPESDDSADHLFILAEKAGVAHDTLWDTVRRERSRSFDFNTADVLLCAMGLYHAWYAELRDFYLNVNLTVRPCARGGCQKHLPDGGPAFCSESCEQQDADRKERRVLRRMSGQCRNGHARTPATTKVRPSGKRECLTCAQEAAERQYRKGRQQLVAA